MRALRCNDYGGPEALTVEDVPDPVAGPGEAVVRVRAASVNHADVLIVANRYQISASPPFTPGSEFAGEVESVGADVDTVTPGDRVRGAAFVGAMAERIAVPAHSLRPLAAGVDMPAAAAHFVVYSTAYHSLRSVAEAAAGDWVVVLGAGGGVGLAAVDVGRSLGARVLAAASSAEKLELCRVRGAEALVNYETEDLKERIKDATGGGADVVIDPVGGRYAEPALRAARWGGRFVTVGFASGDIPRVPLNLVLLKGVVVKGFEIWSFEMNAPELARRDDAELEELFATGRLQPHISATFSLERAREAMRLVADRAALGKVVVEP